MTEEGKIFQGINPDLRKKYDLRGPRYTSYPPANHFAPMDETELFSRWMARNHLDSDPGLSLYVHIPFCRSRCLFCGCQTTVCKGAVQSDEYIRALDLEMGLTKSIIDEERPVRQLALGGGTPNSLEVDALSNLLDSIETHWNVESEAERSIEIDPRTVTKEQLDLLIEHSFRRFSLGVQDFSKEVLDKVRRNQGLMQVESVVSHLREKGCQEINFDLIYGLPGQSHETARSTADRVSSLRPSRVALYSYAHVPWMRPHQKALERFGLPEAELKAAIFRIISDKLLDEGYIPIGMDHFALPEDPLALALKNRKLRRNFMGYTTGRGLDIVGFGASAIASVGPTYSQNEKELEAYQEQVNSGRLPIFRGYLLNHDDEIRRELLQQLSCTFYADLDALSEQFHINAAEYFAKDLQNLEPLVSDGLVQWNSRSIEVTDQGKFFIRNICMIFDTFLSRNIGKSEPTYSKTI